MFYDQTPSGFTLRIRVTPNAAQNGITGMFVDGTQQKFLKISVVSVPEKGKANRELIKYLSKALHLSKSSLTIIRGENDRCKTICIAAPVSAETAAQLTKWEQEYDSATSER